MTRQTTRGVCRECHEERELAPAWGMCINCRAVSLEVPDGDSPCMLDEHGWVKYPTNPLRRVYVEQVA